MFSMILFVYPDCVCLILLWIMAPNIDASLEANLWIKCKKRQSMCVKLKKNEVRWLCKSMHYLHWIFLDSRKALSQRRGIKPSKLLKKICILFNMWKQNNVIESERIQRVDCWYVSLICVGKLRFVMLERDSEMEDIQL